MARFNFPPTTVDDSPFHSALEEFNRARNFPPERSFLDLTPDEQSTVLMSAARLKNGEQKRA